MSDNGQLSNRQANDASPQTDRPLDENLGRSQAQTDRLMQRVIATMLEAENSMDNTQNSRRYARPARLASRTNAEPASANDPTPPEGWRFLPATDLFPSSSPPRSRRRVMVRARRREPTSSSLTTLLANQRLHLSQLIMSAGSARLDGSDSEGQPAPEDFEPPVIRGPIVDFGDISFGGADDAMESDGSDAMMRRWEEGAHLTDEDFQLLDFIGHNPLRSLGGHDERLPQAAQLPPSSSETGASSSVVVRQPWNTDLAWSPYIYQQPAPNSALGVIHETHQGIKDHTLPGTGLERSRLYSLHSSIAELRLNYVITNDEYSSGSPSPRNMLRANSACFTTNSLSNVHVELCFEPSRHCVVERIFVQAPTTGPRCTELMVFASNRRCCLDELDKYDDYTFAQYEDLARDIKNHPDALTDPMPVAYFWLAYEDGYRQIQILPRGVSCKYLYVLMLRGESVNKAMGLKTFRVYGWSGSRAFSEVTIC
ncbi:hypothetical protein H4S02_006871 [Coemansia sp. RSA 2611]|nr:hypothetical protein H4S02_006871 [Coemansia sp. RSA 2611]